MFRIDKYKTVVYVSHPSGGLPENTEKVGNIIKRLHKLYPDILFVSPIHCFGYMYDDVDYKTGLEYCLWLLDKCDEVWVFGDWKNSTGCTCEIAYCQNNGIPWKIIPSDKCFISRPNFGCVVGCILCETDNEGIYCQMSNLNKEIKGGKYL